MDDEPEPEADVYTIDPDAIWATRIEGGDVLVYISEDQTVTFDERAARCLVKALTAALDQK